MLFNSAHFVLFFPVVVAAFFLFPKRLQWLVLLLSSAYFYMAFVPWYVFILVFLIVIDYVLGLALDPTSATFPICSDSLLKKTGNIRKALLVTSIVANIGTLFIFKYFDFFNENIAALATWIDWNYSIASLSLILPIGLSFHVFQSLSYVIEVYRGNQRAEKHLGIYALYVLFFPQLVAGPIERPQNLLHQFHSFKRFDLERAKDGLTLMLWGFFKKLVVADQAAVIVDAVYGDLYNMPPAALFIAAVLFSYQIYCDFSGYSDIARGAARVMGFELMLNFNRPYAARSISEFWRRWHISLSSWIRDYVYLPLGGSRVSEFRHASNLMIAFLLSGLWHGANWTFVIWGAIHGVYLVVGNMVKPLRERLIRVLGLDETSAVLSAIRVATVFFLVGISWIFFRLSSIGDAWFVIKNLSAGVMQLFDPEYMRSEVLVASTLGVGAVFLFLRFAAILFMEVIELFITKHGSPRAFLLCFPFCLRLAGYYTVALWIFLLGNIAARSFIYFQF